MREPFTLEGTHVRLEPLGPGHLDELVEAVGTDRSSFGYTWVPPDRAAMAAYIDKALEHAAAGEQVPFATRSLDHGRLVGSTRFYDLERWDWTTVDPDAARGVAPASPSGELDVVGIGHTWLGPAAQRTAVNTGAKLLMLDHAFAIWGVRLVRLQTDARNARSRAAIARLGCTFEGIRRADRPAVDGSVRDSAIFSMTADEWPAARQQLVGRLAR